MAGNDHVLGTGGSVSAERSAAYDQDGLRSIHNHDFMSEPRFQRAYARGILAAGRDYAWHWRVHTALWAASAALGVPGDFVEFGVNRGFMSSAIMEYLDWDSTGRLFFLLDSFNGIDERQLTDDDIRGGALERNKTALESGFYTLDPAAVIRNFSEWRGARVICGLVPETLGAIRANQLAFVHIDMNCAAPEVAALRHVWPILSAGGIVLLDDYAYDGYRSQKLAMDQLAHSLGVAILSLPTGQGMIMKPAIQVG